MIIITYEKKVQFLVNVILENGKHLDKKVFATNCWNAMSVARYLVETYQHEKVTSCFTSRPIGYYENKLVYQN